jgi:hypothetical protein
MAQFDENYQQQIQKYLDYIRVVSEACQKRCDELRMEAEKKIAALNGNNSDEELKIKIQLKKDLDQMIEEFDKEMRKSFGNSLVTLEEIYRQKELLYLNKIEEQFEQAYS